MEIKESSGEVGAYSASGEVAIHPTIVDPMRHVSIFEHFNINVFQFANNFHWQAVLAIAIPSMVVKFLGEANKDVNLALVVSFGTILAVIINPLAGAISDYVPSRLGRRRPFMIYGTIINVIVLILFAFPPAWFTPTDLLITFVFLFLFLQISNNAANSPWNAIIPDKVPEKQRGVASGFYNFLTFLGTAVGSLVAGLIISTNDPLPMYRTEIMQTFLLVAIVQIIFVVYTVITVKETPLQKREKFKMQVVLRCLIFNPRKYADFSWVLLASFLMMMGTWSISSFLQYYFDDVLGGPHVKTIILGTPFAGDQFLGVLFIPILLLTSLPAALIGGWLSDRLGRKMLIYVSGALMAVVCIIFVFYQTQPGSLVAAAVFGVASGVYSSVIWAMTCDVLPPTDESGKYIGIASAAGILPQVVGVLLGAVILQSLRNVPNHFGYTMLMAIAISCFVVGTVLIRLVKSAK